MAHLGVLMSLLACPGGPEIRGAESVEWLAYDADVIVTGRIAGERRVVGPGGRELFILTVDVDEALKGKAERKLEFVASALHWESLRPKEDGPVLVFLVRSTRQEELFGGALPRELALRTGIDPPMVIALSDTAPKRPPEAAPTSDPKEQARRMVERAGQRRPPGPLGHFDAEFRELRHREEILPAVRKAVQAVRGKAESIAVDAPWESDLFRALYSGSSVYLVVPLDGATEERAIRWIEKGPGNREDAVRILAHFKSAGNIARLRELLSDRSHLITSRDGRKLRVYPVRARAAEALGAWGESFEAPVTEEPVDP